MQEYQYLEVDETELKEILEKNYHKHAEDVEKLKKSYENKFPQWMMYLKTNFSLLVHGIGSKIDIIERFCSTMLSNDYYVLTVKGFESKFTLREIIRTLIVDVFNESRCPVNADNAVNVLKTLLERNKLPIFLVVYNIDGPSLRSSKCQTILSTLASSSYVHLIATMENINAPLLWDTATFSRYNFVWVECNTFEPHLYLAKSNREVAVVEEDDSFAIFKRLYNTNSDKIKKLVRIIVEDSVENEQHQSKGISLEKLNARAKEEMLLRREHSKSPISLLNDFFDHGIMKKTSNNSVILNVDRKSVEAFFEAELGESE